jgi:hypothetical protein
MSATTAVLRGRVAAERLMTDTVSITRVTGSSTNSETGVVTPTTSTIYTGAAKVQQGGVPIGQPRDLGEASVQLVHLQLHIPVSATGVRVDDIATVTASTLDPDLVGRVFNIRSVAHKSYLTARRMDIEEVLS